jgi:hypothetical protein
MRSDAVQDPIFYQPFDLSNIEFGSVPVDEQDPVQNFKRQFEASLAKKRELFTNGIKVENAPPWHSAQVFVTDKPALPPRRTVVHASPSGDIKEETNWPDSRILTQTVHLLGSIIDVLHACHISRKISREN